MEVSSIQEFYKGRSVLITGATGFCGKSLLEKLLRSCPQVAHIFLLMRPKKGQEVQRRLQHLFRDPVFDTVRRDLKEDKVHAISGDIAQTGLGISAQNRDQLCQEVSVVFHVAATVKLNEKLKVALEMNVMGTQQVVELCKQMPLLTALVYVSTAYSQCPLSEIEEKVYPTPHDQKRLTECINWLSDDDFHAIEPVVLGNWPNTYSYSKALAENIIHENREVLPVAIFRPSIMLSAWKEPIPGWIDNANGPTMGIQGSSLGMIHSGHVDVDKTCDIIPVDTVVNALIAVAWETSLKRCGNTSVYNFVSGNQQPITWGEYFNLCREYAIKNPPSRAVWYWCLFLCRNRFTFLSTSFVLEFIPACIRDIVPFITTGKHKNVDIYWKSIKFLKVVSHFSTHEWKFHDNNIRLLLKTLSPRDHELFYFDLTQLDWREYLKNYMAGLRFHLLKEPTNTLPMARRRYTLLYLLHCFCQAVTILFFYKTIRRLQHALSSSLNIS